MDSLRFKRFLSLALAFLMVLSNVPVQVFANETSSECTHQIHVVNSTATCTEAGVTTTTCGTCGMVLETMETGATGHSFADGVCTVEGCGAKATTYVAPANVDAPALPTATVTEIENEDLTFAMNFKADEVTDEQLAYYGDWYADFELTVNKDMTLNANGGADGYLSGQYDEWNENWVNVPLENTKLTANKTLKIMEYAAETLGESGLKLTYADIVSSVKDFDCGMFLEPAFLAANPDLEVTLELRMYNPANTKESYVIGKTNTFTQEDLKPKLPTATVTEIKNDDLTFAMNFKADEVTDEQLAYYGDWYADFELTVNKDMTLNANGGADGYLSGQYDEWNENWVNVPLENTKLTANKTLKIMEYAAEALGESGLKLTYADIVSSVKDFDCGMFLEPAFLAANPDLKVTLELKMYNPANTKESYVIGKTNTFTQEDLKPKLPTATVTEIKNDDLTFAMNFKANEVSDEQLAYYGNWYADFELTVNKDMTLNANGGADGYLSGQYDEWNENWVNVPLENTKLTANKTLKIMEYAAETLGESGLKLTYADIVSSVKDFDCGMFLEPAFLAANPDLKVTLELKMYNPANTKESYVIGKTNTFTQEDLKPELPTATVTEIKNDDLTFAMNFKADEVTDEQLAYYGDWYADFELTVNKDMTLNANGGADGYLSGQYDEWNENWVNVPLENTKLTANKTLKIMEYAAEALDESGLKLTYADIVSSVKDFDCGMFLEPAFLAANPDLKVTLELRMYNPANTKESYVIGETYVFTVPVAPELPTATVTEIKNEKLTFAMNFKADEVTDEQLAYYGDWYADFELTVNQDVTLNANGGADGYLSGQYDKWSENWVNVPFENTILTAEQPLKIMAYAAEAMGEPGLKYTYAEVYDVVKDFDCGMFLEPEFLCNLEKDLEITLELKMYNNEDEAENYVIGKAYTFTVSVAPELPTATVAEIENDELTFAMNFKADKVTDEQLAYYGDWYADFELTVNKDMTLNANGGADGYLSGQYDKWSENWVNVPFENTTLTAGQPLKIMAYAAEAMGEPGLKYTYAEVYDVVKDFDCGMFFEPAFLAANSDLEVTLELKMYHPDDEELNFVIGDTHTFTVPELPTATATKIENEELTFAMNFKADEVTDKQLAFYGNWYADFELTVNKDMTLNANGGADGYLSGQYDKWSENWVNVPFEDTTLTAGQPLKIMAYAAEAMGEPGLKYTYAEVYDVVQDFDCGMFFEPAFLAANPDLEVTLELRMYNPADETVAYSIGETYTFKFTDLEYVAYNTNTDTLYSDVADSMDEAMEGQTVILLKNAEVKRLWVEEGVKFDLNGYALTANYVTVFGDIVDNSESNAGLLKVNSERIMLQSANDQLPVKTADGYQFVEIKYFNYRYLPQTGQYVFQPMFEQYANDLLTAGKATTGVEIMVRVSWENSQGGYSEQLFGYSDDFVAGFVNSYKLDNGKYGKMFTLTLKNVNKDLIYEVVVKSDRGVELVSASTLVEAPKTTTTEDITLNTTNTAEAPQASAVVPEGTKLAENATGDSLALTVEEVTGEANITLGKNEEKKSVDVHIEGIAADNTIPMIITLKEFADKGLNEGNLALYHVENGATNPMTQVFTLEEVDAHNEFYYDPATGDVTMALATFSEVTAVENTTKAWEGNFDYSWYTNAVAAVDGEAVTEYLIANADQLAAFGAIVGGMDGQKQDSFAGKTVKLLADINLGDKESENNPDIIFYPIGYYNSEGTYERTNTAITSGLRNFEGTFDGNGHTISNFYQNTWEMKGDHDWYSPEEQYYRDGMGLFGKVYGGTVENLTVRNFKSDGEIATTGVIAAYADGAIFENISIFDCNPRVYNIGNGGIVGCVGWYANEADLKTTFTNITVDNSNKISALWGSYDVACGGIVGQYYPTSGQTSAGTPKNGGIEFKNCHVSAIMDVYNDVCGNYQYYAYRYAGMMIGSIRENTTIEIDGVTKTIPDMTGITATDCTVNYGDWNDYYYCEFVSNGHPSYAGADDYKFSRVPHSELAFTDSNGNGVVDADERASVTGCKHDHTEAEDNKAIYLPFHQLFTGYGWGVNSIGLEKYSGIVTDQGITEGDQEGSVKKFEGKVTELANGTEVKLGDIFSFVDNGVELVPDALTVAVTNLDENNPVSATIVYDKENWENGTITFTGTGAVKLTIQDYYFCIPAEITVTITEKQAVEKFETKFTGDFLYRVGNQNAVKLDSLFKAKDGAEIGTVDVTIETISGASGTYTSNATWTNGTIQFSNTGIVKVTIKDDDTYCTPTELILEVVDAVNVTSAASVPYTYNDKPYDAVLLNNVSNATTITIEDGYCFYGNGFELKYTGDGSYRSASLAYGFVTVMNGGVLDNTRVICKVFPKSYMYTKQMEQGNDGRYPYGYSAVVVSGNSVISNCYIYGARNNILVSSGNVKISNTVTESGSMANIHIKGSNADTVTLHNVTTIQYLTTSDASFGATNNILGFGVAIGDDDSATNANIRLTGNFIQHNWVTKDDANAMNNINGGYACSAINGALDAALYQHTNENGVITVNMGIACLNKLDLNVDDKRTNTDVVYQKNDVTMNGYTGKVYSIINKSGDPDTGAGEYESETNANIMPDVVFADNVTGISLDTTYNADQAAWISTLELDLDNVNGGSYDFGFDKIKVQKYGFDLAFTVKDSSGLAIDKATSIPFNSMENRQYVLSVTDDKIYDKNGNDTDLVETYELNFVIHATKTSIEPPKFSGIGSGVRDSIRLVSSSGGNWRPAYPALKGVSVTYWSESEKKVKTVDLSTLTDIGTISDKTWTYTCDDYTLTITGGPVHSDNSYFIYPMIAKRDNQNILYFASKNKDNSTGTTARNICLQYVFTDKNASTTVGQATAYNGTAIATVKYADLQEFSWTSFQKGTVEEVASSTCVTSDTMVMLADGTQKRVDELAKDDILLAWDFETGAYVAAPILALENHADDHYRVLNLNFSDGTAVKVIDSHGFFDADSNDFVYISEKNVEDYIGHSFVKVNGESYAEVQLAGYTVDVEYTGAWWVQTAKCNNFISDNMFSMTTPDFEGWFDYFDITDDMKYDEDHKLAEIEKYGLCTYEELAHLGTYEDYVAMNAQYLNILIGRGVVTMDDVLWMLDRYI